MLPAAVAGAQSEPVAKVGDTPITLARFDHWMFVSVRSSTPRDRHAVVPALGTARWRRHRDEVMQFLLSGLWIHGEAALQGVTVTHARVLREYRKTRAESFPRRRDFRKFLRESGMTVNDVVYRVELDMLSNRLRAKVMRPYKTDRGRQKALERFVEDFRARWIAQTSCAPVYKTRDCGQELPAPA